MRKLTTLLTLSFIFFIGITYLYYADWRSQQQRTATIPYIPASAALAYEVTDFAKQWEYCQQTPIGQTLSNGPLFTTIQQAIAWLKQEILTDHTKLAKVPLILSVHKTPQGTPGCLFYFNTYDKAPRDFWEAVISKLQQDTAYHTTTRAYGRLKVVFWHKEGTTQQFACLRHKQYVIASFSTSLIEELAETFASNQATDFLSLHKSGNTYGSLYINPKRLSQLIHTFVKPDQAKVGSNTLATLLPPSQFNLQLTPYHVLLRGTVGVAASQHLPHTMQGQTPSPLALAAYLPQHTATLQHVTFSDADRFLEAWQAYNSSSGTSDDKHLLMATLLPLLQSELAHCTLQGGTGGQLILMQVTDPQAFINVLKGAKVVAPVAAAQTYRVTPNCFRNGIPGVLFPAFKASYLTYVDSYIVLANSQEALKTWRTQYRKGQTWAQSATKKAWLTGILDKAHLTWQVDLQEAWPTLIQSLQNSWQQTLKNHAPLPIDASLQLLNDPHDGCYASILLKHKEAGQVRTRRMPPTSTPHETPSPIAKVLPSKVLLQATAPLAHAPWFVKSHVGKGHYILLQDIQHQLYLLEPSGKLLWKKVLKGPITTPIFEIDFYKNGKKQYLFATDQQLHLIDYYGRRVSPYPQRLPAPAQLQVVDYNRDKNYRLLLATAQGDIYLKDKRCKSLPGWGPRALGHAFADAPFHIRLHNKDYFLALQTDGTLQVRNRRGKSYPGFPLVLKTPTHNPLVVRKTTADTVLTVVTDEGKQIDLSLTGQIRKTRQLDRTRNTRRFIVCPNQASGDQYALVRQDENQVVVMNTTGKTLFELPYTNQQLLVQYYSFEKTKQFYALNSPEEKLTRLYDFAGKQLATIPVQNGHKVRLIFSKARRQLEVYGCDGAQCVKYVLKL